MYPRLLRAAAAFLAVLVAYLTYAIVVVPWIEPTLARSSGRGPAPQGIAKATHHEQRRNILESLFPAGAWELNDRRVKVLETEYGMLLLVDYHTREGGQLEIHPCTLVLEVPSDKPQRRPHYLALQAPQGAVLQFDRSIDLRRAEIGQPIGGRLQGEVRIFSPATSPDAEDALEIVTQNVQMDSGRVWTPHEVSFRFGRSYGGGRGLTIELLSANSGKSQASDALAVAGVRTLELSHLEKAHLEAPPDGLFSEPSTGKPRGPIANKPRPEGLDAPLEITCQGPFRFDFEELVASFHDDVDVRRLQPEGPGDQLNCQLLEVYFTLPRGNPFQPAERRAGAHMAMKPELPEDKPSALRKIVAIGRPLFVRAPSIGAFVQGDRLEYDVATRRLRLENQQSLNSDPAGADATPVRRNAVLQHQGRTFEAPRLQYDLGPGRRLGKLWAAGPGVFRGPVPKSTKRLPELAADATFEIAWRHAIHLRPHEGAHVASVTGGASARVGTVGGFNAGELHVWLHEVPEDDASTAPGDEPRYRIVPDRLLAQNGVDFHSPTLSGGTGKLEAWFEDAPPLPADAPPQPGLRPQEDQHAAGQRQAFDVRGEVIQLRILRRGETTVLEDATLLGNALLRETRTKTPGELPLMLAGSRVEVRGASNSQAQIVVLGDPSLKNLAQVAARGATFTGWQLQVDQAANRIWIDGPGKLMLPMRDRGASRAGRPAHAMPRPTSVTVTWRKGLDFDGRRVLIEDRVETRGESQVIRSDSLQAILLQPIDLARLEQARHAEVSRLIFGGRPEDTSGVTFENQTVENGARRSVEKGQTRNLDLDVIAGRMHAAGPGWIESVRQGGFSLAGPLKSETAGPAPASPQDSGLTFVRVNFQEAISGQAFSEDFNQWKVTFHTNVETLVGPVTRWEERLNADSPSGLGARGMLLTSREMSITQMGVSPQGEAQLELTAHGQPHIESLSFRADGDRLSYDGAKGLLVLEGGREEARFWHRQNTGVEIDGAAQRIQYWPQENRLDADLRFLDLSGFRNALTPGRRTK